ncbi:serine hydrolase domain-containing protein [Amorphoplanes digitatis]|uniref:CubicO group peptidase (Beta-lactamase class C family) n=1 Tax=Actinoplanes digitatis TaxID=1868 RepID=A0A7W7I1B2_9ACTN|nr:serine hydrolase domain-containing protein [Actinoplanes digitatis]MBB4764653.1 CubicO group peptidase (beta-lactamase class C family) [Actinoplanes digitatis]GID91396.1 serine hydrolase [Actinoplanes digitatis]
MGDADEWMRGFRAIAAPESEQERFAGAVLVCRRDERILAEAYGMADRERKIPNEVSTRFRNGSLTKMFTAVAVVRLIQAGLVDPDAPVGTYLSDYPNSEVASKVTVHHLLTHTGGTGDFFSPEYEEHRTELRTVADYLRLFGERARRFEPGAWFDYSNYGFILLGAVIERVSGQSYYDYVDDHVFAPAGMRRSGALPFDTPVADLAVGYTAEDGQVFRDTDTLPYRGSPAGGGYTTVEDLWRFATALTGNRLLDARHTALMTTAKLNAGWSGRCVAYGFVDRTVYGIRTLGHTGGSPGASAELTIFPDSGHVVAVLANLDPPIASQVSEFICHRLPVSRTARCRTC